MRQELSHREAAERKASGKARSVPLTREQKETLVRILAALLLFCAGLAARSWGKLALMAAAYLLTGWPVIREAAEGILHGELLDESFLMTVASLGAFALREYAEGAAVMLLFQIGELFQELAESRSRASVAALAALRPETASVLEDGKEVQKKPEEVAVGDLLRIRPGERIPVDGVVTEGSAFLDTAAVTGEPEPREAAPGTAVLSGSTDISGVLTVRAGSVYASSTVSRILELTESAAEGKASAERMVTRFARVYTPAVVIAAALLCLLPPILFGEPFSEWLSRGLTFLVISCPCALVLSVPLSFFGGLGAASRRGILIKGGAVLERAAALRQIVFDKTGTLTTGSFRLGGVFGAEETLSLAAAAEADSAHPAAKAIRAAAGAAEQPESVKELPGYGVSAVVRGKTVCVGNRRLMREQGIEPEEPEAGAVCVYVSADRRYLGRIELTDDVRPDAASALAALKRAGVSELVMLTGDSPAAASRVAAELGLKTWSAGLLPQDKVSALKTRMARTGPTAFVGDGVNDAPVLAAADVGIAMGGIGSDAAVETADVVILNDRLSALPELIRISRKTCAIARENIIFSLAVKLLILLLGAFGAAQMWLAVFADVGVAMLAVLNAMRAMRPAKLSEKREGIG